MTIALTKRVRGKNSEYTILEVQSDYRRVHMMAGQRTIILLCRTRKQQNENDDAHFSGILSSTKSF